MQTVPIKRHATVISGKEGEDNNNMVKTDTLSEDIIDPIQAKNQE